MYDLIPAQADRFLDRAADQLTAARAATGWHRDRLEERASENVSRANLAIRAARL